MTNATGTVVIQALGDEARDLVREVEAARLVVAAAEGLQDELAKLRPSDIGWPTKAAMDRLMKTRSALSDAIHDYRRVMLTVQHRSERHAAGTSNA